MRHLLRLTNDPDIIYEFEERAGIYEFDARMSRTDSEKIALNEIIQKYHLEG